MTGQQIAEHIMYDRGVNDARKGFKNLIEHRILDVKCVIKNLKKTKGGNHLQMAKYLGHLDALQNLHTQLET